MHLRSEVGALIPATPPSSSVGESALPSSLKYKCIFQQFTGEKHQQISTIEALRNIYNILACVRIMPIHMVSTAFRSGCGCVVFPYFVGEVDELLVGRLNSLGGFTPGIPDVGQRRPVSTRRHHVEDVRIQIPLPAAVLNTHSFFLRSTALSLLIHPPVLLLKAALLSISFSTPEPPRASSDSGLRNRDDLVNLLSVDERANAGRGVG